MKLYEINAEIENCIDQETGEIDVERFNELQLEKQTKIENLALWYKNLISDVEQLKNEISNLKERLEKKKKEAENKKEFLKYVLENNPFETPKVKVSYRKSTQVQIDNGFVEWANCYADDLLTYKIPEPNKTAIKEAIKSGRDVMGAVLVENNNISIK